MTGLCWTPLSWRVGTVDGRAANSAMPAVFVIFDVCLSPRGVNREPELLDGAEAGCDS